MIAEAEVGVRGKLDLMSNIYTIIDIILWMEFAREIHRDILNYLFYHEFIILQLFHSFVYFLIWNIIILSAILECGQ